MNASPEVDKYISTFPPQVQEMLQLMRQTISQAAPDAEEVISYKMPAYRLNGMLVWFAAFKGHVGFYPRRSGIVEFKKELEAYKTSKVRPDDLVGRGTIQFPLNKPLPVALITKIVKFRVKENMGKA